MKNKVVTKAFSSAVVLVSICCFLYVNTAVITKSDSASATLVPATETSVVADDSKMPDLKLVKNVVSIISKFLPAK